MPYALDGCIYGNVVVDVCSSRGRLEPKNLFKWRLPLNCAINVLPLIDRDLNRKIRATRRLQTCRSLLPAPFSFFCSILCRRNQLLHTTKRYLTTTVNMHLHIIAYRFVCNSYVWPSFMYLKLTFIFL
jgi:hypothetical protein